MKNPGTLLLFCGPSGSGKTTIVRHLLTVRNDLAFSVSATTRPKRENEIHGKDYYFISVDEFKKKIDAGEFIEWEQVYQGLYYGTLQEEIERLWKENKTVVFDVDVQGGQRIKNIFGDRVLAVFVMPPDIHELHRRLRARNSETPESFGARIAKSEKELGYADRFDKVIVNDILEKSLEEAERLAAEFLDTKH
ncbi:MAG: guanylate kinase [Bacteroidia bacterium]|nr:guanylate kinase [Bacteroidia bacterium]